MGFVLDQIGAGQAASQAAGTAVTGLTALAAESVASRAKGRDQRVRELAGRRFYRSPLLVGFYVILAVELVQRVLGFLMGAAIGSSLGLAGVTDSQLIVRSVVSVSPLVVGLLTLVAVVFIAKRAAHYLRRHAYAWIAAALALTALIDNTLGGVAAGRYLGSSLSVSEILLSVLMSLGLYLLAGALGYRRAKKAHMEFVVGRMFRELPRADQEALVELIREPAVERA